jgi:hypothetical protein
MSHEQFVAINDKIFETMMARIELVRVLGEVLGTQLDNARLVFPACCGD